MKQQKLMLKEILKLKYAEEVKSAYEEVARQNKAANRKILIIASILMFLVWLILR
jgi:hypothetical protein